MAQGRKTGGRRPGSKNKRTLEVEQRMEELDCDPLSAMVELAAEARRDGDKQLAAKLYTELSAFVVPKRRAIEHTTPDKFAGVTGAELEAQYNAARRSVIEEFMSLPEAERQAFLETEH